MAQATTLKPGQIRHLLRVTTATSRHPERDCLVLLLGITCGMRVTEIAQIEVQDVLFPSGLIRQEVSLRAAITKGCRCPGSLDHVPIRSWPLFKARHVLRTLFLNENRLPIL